MIWPSTQGPWFERVNRFARATPGLHTPMRLYAEYGVVLFAALMLASWWLARREPRPSAMAAALWTPIGMLVSIGLNQPLSDHVREPRPYTVFPHALVLVGRSQDFSFPSDHAVMAGAVAAGVLLANRRLGAVTAVAAVLLAAARVYVGAHFPIDVLAGLALGAVVTIVGFLATRRLIVRVLEQLARTPLRSLVASRNGTR